MHVVVFNVVNDGRLRSLTVILLSVYVSVLTEVEIKRVVWSNL